MSTGKRKLRQKSLMVSKFFSMLLGGTLTMLAVSVMLMSDSIIAGILVGSDAVAGITLVTPIYFVSAFLGSLFSLGIPVLYEKAIGHFDKEEADRLFGFGILMSVLVGLFLLLMIFLFDDLYLSGYNLSDSIRQHADAYLVWMRFTLFLLPIQGLLAYMVYFDGDEFISTASNVVQGLGNIIGSIMLCRVMGTYGIGLASFVFTLVACGILAVHFFREKNSLRPRICFSFSLLKQTVWYSIIDAGSYFFLGLLTVILNWFVSHAFGPAYLIMVSLTVLCREFQLVFEGLGEAIRPAVGIYLSENCLPGVRRIYYLAKYVAIITGIGMMILLILLSPVLPGVLDITDPVLLDTAARGVRIMAAGYVFIGLLYLSVSYYLLLDRILFGLVVSGLRDFVFTAGLALLLGSLFGFNGLFAAFALGPALTWAVSIVYIRVRYPADAPLLLSGRMKGKQDLLYELALRPDQITQTRDQMEEELEALSCDPKTVYRVMLLFEELLMLIYEKNKGGEILCECSVLIEADCIRMIIRDSGKAFDIADPDLPVTSLRSYIVANYAQEVSDTKGHLVAMNFNRNVFEIRR